MQDLRKNYTFGSLTREMLPQDPMSFFERWWKEVQSAELPEWFEINAMTLSTVTPAQVPMDKHRVSSRIVLLKHLDDGFCFFTNYDSHKGEQLAANPLASLSFFWPFFERQVRIEGVVTRTSPEMSDNYFASRPRSSQLGAMASPQSKVIPDDLFLASRIDELEKQLDGKAVPRPPQWGGYRLTPLLIEFWQGRPSRLHDRFRYQRSNIKTNEWLLERLAP